MRWLILLAVLSFGLLPLPAVAQEHDPVPVAEQVLALLLESDYEGVSAMFSAEMATALPGETLQMVWEQQLLPMTGAYQEELLSTQEGNTAILTLQFENALVDMIVTINAEGEIDGLFFGPADPEKTGLYHPPAYADPTTFTEEEIMVNGLPGVLTLPNGAGPFPGVVLVHGSGPNDRDGTVGVGKPFRDLAWGLASQGIAVLRYEKRTRVDVTLNPETLTLAQEVNDDALAALELLANHAKIDRVYLLGHSLGALMAPQIAAQTSVDLSGVLMLAVPTRSMTEIIVAQTHYLANLDGEITPEEQAMLDETSVELELVRNLTAEDSEGAPILYFSRPQWLEFNAYDPVAIALTLDIPLLILQGERDYQVLMEDFAGWQAGLADYPDVVFISYPTLNHLFIAGEGTPSPEEYNLPGNVSEEVVMDIVEWIHPVAE